MRFLKWQKKEALLGIASGDRAIALWDAHREKAQAAMMKKGYSGWASDWRGFAKRDDLAWMFAFDLGEAERRWILSCADAGFVASWLTGGFENNKDASPEARAAGRVLALWKALNEKRPAWDWLETAFPEEAPFAGHWGKGNQARKMAQKASGARRRAEMRYLALGGLGALIGLMASIGAPGANLGAFAGLFAATSLTIGLAPLLSPKPDNGDWGRREKWIFSKSAFPWIPSLSLAKRLKGKTPGDWAEDGKSKLADWAPEGNEDQKISQEDWRAMRKFMCAAWLDEEEGAELPKPVARVRASREKMVIEGALQERMRGPDVPNRRI